MQNIEQALQVSVRQDATSVELVQVNEHIRATEAGITSTQGDINAAENDLESEKHALSRARAHLREQRNINKAVRVAVRWIRPSTLDSHLRSFFSPSHLPCSCLHPLSPWRR